MYAVIQTGGKQYRVAPGDRLQVESIEAEIGSEVEFGGLLAVSSASGIAASTASRMRVFVCRAIWVSTSSVTFRPIPRYPRNVPAESKTGSPLIVHQWASSSPT